MIQIELSSNADAILRRVQGFPPRLAQAVAGAMDRQNQLTIAHAQRHYLSGPRPQRLGVRTNRLRSSLTAAPARVTGDSVISSIGTNVAYAGAHEFGFDGSVTVRAHQRNIFRSHQTGGGSVFDMRTGRVRRQAVRTISLLQGQATVRSHARRVKMRARPFLRPAVEDSRLEYSKAVSTAIERAWSGGAS